MKATPDSVTLPEGSVGAATLERMACAPAYNRWTYDRISRWIGHRVLEVGAGIGNLSQFFVDRERVVLTDTDSRYRSELQRRFTEQRRRQRRASRSPVPVERRHRGDRRAARVEVVELSLPVVPDGLLAERFDTIVCLNVLEHVEDDAASLQTVGGLLEPGGHIVLLVPAIPQLYGSLDRALGHYRRYTPGAVRSLFARAGVSLRHMEYFNLVGILGWWWSGRVLRRRMIPIRPLKLYDRLVPILRLETLLPVRFGLSLIAVGGPTE